MVFFVAVTFRVPFQHGNPFRLVIIGNNYTHKNTPTIRTYKHTQIERSDCVANGSTDTCIWLPGGRWLRPFQEGNMERTCSAAGLQKTVVHIDEAEFKWFYLLLQMNWQSCMPICN